MLKTKELSIDIRNWGVEAHKSVKGCKSIGKQFSVPILIVGSIIRLTRIYFR